MHMELNMDQSYPKMVTIPIEVYIDLRTKAIELSLLRRAGVDNWEGYGEGFEDFEELILEMRREVRNGPKLP